MNDDSVKTVVYKRQQAAKQFAEVFHRSSPPSLVLTTRSWIRRPVGINTWMILPPGRWLPIPGASKFQISLAIFRHYFSATGGTVNRPIGGSRTWRTIKNWRVVSFPVEMFLKLRHYAATRSGAPAEQSN